MQKEMESTVQHSAFHSRTEHEEVLRIPALLKSGHAQYSTFFGGMMEKKMETTIIGYIGVKYRGHI